MTTSNLLIIVARMPIPGQVKTRLAASIGDDRACCLYEAFLADLGRRFRSCPDWDVSWGYTGGDAFSSTLESLTGDRCGGVSFIPQCDGTFSERLTNLFAAGFERGYSRIAIMASDSPHLPISVADDAFRCLAQHDVTMGRVADGGYYLIGLSQPSDLLLDLPMSTSDAGDAVVQRAACLGLTHGEIGRSFDVDVEADLDLLRCALAPDGESAPETWSALHRLGLLPVPTVNPRDSERSASMAAVGSSRVP